MIEPGHHLGTGEAVRTDDAGFGSNRERHGPDEAVDRHHDSGGVVVEHAPKAEIELRGHAAASLSDRLSGHLRQFVIREEHVHLVRIPQQEGCGVEKCSVAQVRTVLEVAAMNELVEDEVMIGIAIELRLLDHPVESGSRIVKIAGHQESTSTAEMNGGTATTGGVSQRRRGVPESLDHPIVILGIDVRRIDHLTTLAAISNVCDPVTELRDTGT